MVTQGLTAILLGAFLTLIAAWSLGRLLLRSLRVNLCRLEEDLFAVLAGSACLSGLAFVLCCFHVARENRRGRSRTYPPTPRHRRNTGPASALVATSSSSTFNTLHAE